MIFDKLIYVGICIAIFVIFKRASKNNLKSFLWSVSAAVVLFFAVLFSEFTSINGQRLLERMTRIEPSAASEITFTILTFLLPILWLIFFVKNLRIHNKKT